MLGLGAACQLEQAVREVRQSAESAAARAYGDGAGVIPALVQPIVAADAAEPEAPVAQLWEQSLETAPGSVDAAEGGDELASGDVHEMHRDEPGLGRHLGPFFGGTEIAKLTANDVTAYISAKRRAGLAVERADGELVDAAFAKAGTDRIERDGERAGGQGARREP